MIQTEKCAPLIRQIHSAMEKDANNALRGNDLTMAQVYLLLALKNNPNSSCSLKELEKALQIGQSTTVGLVKRLEQKGFVACCQDASDKRIKIVTITPEGDRICDLSKSSMNATLQRLTTGLTEQEKTDFLTLLQKVHSNL